MRGNPGTCVRQAENLRNYPHVDQSAWMMMRPEGRKRRALPRTVIQATAKKRWRVKVGIPDCLSGRGRLEMARAMPVIWTRASTRLQRPRTSHCAR
jgi:hypothetical protein